MTSEIDLVKNKLLDLQNRICHFLEQEETKKSFQEDAWSHESGGGGLTRVLSDGNVIEKAGVNFSHVFGSSLAATATARHPELAGCAFQAMGVSVVIHPYNPYVPTTHANVRFIQVEKKDGSKRQWFGGGFDLTPYYGFVEDCVHWHQTAKAACDPYGPTVYADFKKWCDTYFYLKHRAEPRGIGGIFFDDLIEWGFEKTFLFMCDVGNHFIEAYQPILAKRKNISFSENEKQFQLYRRGRYVEFNLLYDRGTLFGLQSGGRIESILMSLPPHVIWKYDWHPEAQTILMENFLKPRDWIIE